MRIPRSLRDLQAERESLLLDFSSQRLFDGRVRGDTFRSGGKRQDHVRSCARFMDLAWSANRPVNTQISEIPIHLPHFIANIFLGTFAGEFSEFLTLLSALITASSRERDRLVGS